MAEKRPERNYCLDFIKGIACVCIVLMHVRFPASWRTLMLSTMRFAVPFFFMVSGFYTFSPDKESKETALKKIRHIAVIVLYTSVFYLLFAAVQIALGGEKLKIALKLNTELVNENGILPLRNEVKLSLYSLKTWIIYSIPSVIVPQMWFLFSLLYVYILYRFVFVRMKKKLYIAIPVLSGGYILLAQVAYLAGFSVDTKYYRNWLFVGLPFFLMGRYINENKEKINISNKALIIVIAVSTAICPIEMHFFGRVFAVHIASFPQVISMFILAIKNPDSFKNSPITKMGTKLSMFVYIIHPFIWHTTEYVYDIIGANEEVFMQYAMPAIVLTFTILLSIAVEKKISSIKIRKEAKV